MQPNPNQRHTNSLEINLPEAQSILKSMISDTTDIVFVKDLQGRYIVANQAAADLLNITIEEIIGRDDTALFDPEIARSIAQIDRQVIATETSFSYEEDIFNSQTSKSLLTSKYPWRDNDGNICGIIGISKDITDSKRSEKQLRKILDSLFSFVGVLSPDGILIEANRTALEVANLKPEDVLNKPFAEAYWWSYSTQSQTRLNKAIARAAAGKTVRYDVEVRIGDEKRILIDFSLVPLFNVNGKVEYLIPSGIDITEREQSKKALTNSENQLRNILDSLPVYIGLLTPDGRVITINQTALEAINIKLEDVSGQPFAETPWWTSTEVKAKIEDAIRRAAAGEAVRFDTLTRGRGEGNSILVEFNMIPIFNDQGEVEYLVPSGTDITEREQSKKALEQSQQELQLITEVIPQQIWTALPDGTVDYISRRWQKYTGINLEQLQDRGWEIIIHPDDLERVSQNWHQAIKTGNNYNLEARLRSKNGAYRWFLNRARPLRDFQGEIIKWYGTNTDISRIKELEATLREQTEDLIQANQLKDDFLAIVSHELRTPLNPILGWAQLLAAGRLDAEKATTGIGIIERNAKLQAQIIDDLLDVSRILRDKIELKVAPLNLESVIRLALSTVQLAAEAKSIQIETIFEPNVKVIGDARRLQQIVWNLVSNAIKFTPDNGRVIVKLERIGQQAQIQVIDTGQGISPEFLPYVFERFRQAQSSRTRKFGGLGLGLAIARHLTELHGGTVGVESAGEGQGTTFKIKLPLIDTPTVKSSNNVSIDRFWKSDRLNGLKVLVVDDEIDSLNVLAITLEQAGATVSSFTSANAAIEAIRKSIPDLIISDIGMPEVDGYTMMSQIRKLPQGKNIPAIALSAYAREIDRVRSIEVGFQHHLGKPVDIPTLITTITTLTKS